ncbi:hypothetical protein PLACP1_30190 [Planifilum fimeticola]
MAAFIPGASPPLVNTAIRFTFPTPFSHIFLPPQGQILSMRDKKRNADDGFVSVKGKVNPSVSAGKHADPGIFLIPVCDQRLSVHFQKGL